VLARLLLTDRAKEMPPNLAVMSTSALVGRIESAGPFTARLLLLSDPSFTIRARILRRIDPARTRWVKVLTKGAAADEPLTEQNNAPVPVLAAGDGAGGLVADATTYANILPGDRLVTADDDPYLRREVRIGVVEEVVVRPENHQQVVVRVRPLEDLAALRDVYILYWKPL
jgi:cell shape-determining protein MreC